MTIDKSVWGNFTKMLILCNIVLWTAVVLAALGDYLLSHYNHNSFTMMLGLCCGFMGFTLGVWGFLMFIAASSVGRFRKERV